MVGKLRVLHRRAESRETVVHGIVRIGFELPLQETDVAVPALDKPA